MGRADQSAWHLSRSGPLFERPLRQGSGLRWLSLMLLPEIPWAGRCWALPFLTVLAPSERYWQEHKPGQRQHKKLTDWSRQVLIQVAALWLPHRRIIGIGDASFAAIDLLNNVRPWVTMITRLRLDAALHKPAPERVPGKAGRPPVVGKRQPTLKQRLVHFFAGRHRFAVEHPPPGLRHDALDQGQVMADFAARTRGGQAQRTPPAA
jgi:hypothetical protein